MKKLVLGTVLAVISVPAFATKARMIALGENVQDNIGSLYFSDSRNIFQNAAYANDYKDMFIAEWGVSGVAATTAKGDTDTVPQAEGGFLKSHGNYVYGLYLGAESPYTNEIRSYSRLVDNSTFHQDNQIDVFFAGEGSMKWGLNATYSASKDSSKGARQSSASVRGGIIKNNLEAFLNVALKNEARIASATATGVAVNGEDKFQGKRGFEAGATYNLDIVKVFGYVRHATWQHDANSTIGGAAPRTAYEGKFDGTYWLYQVGAGKEHKLTDKTTLFTKFEYLSFNREVDPTSGNATKTITLDDWRAPLTIGLEHDASSWLTVRGSISQNILGQTDNSFKGQEGVIAPAVQGLRSPGKRSIANTTNVNAGATLKFGEFSIDGVIGTNSNSQAVADSAVTDSKTEKGILSLDNLMTRVAMTYKF